MDAISKLVAAEAIRNTKGSYWYYLDTKDWDRMATVFTEDAIFDMREEGAFGVGESLAELKPVEQAIAEGDPAVTVGNRNFVDMLAVALKDWKTVHHGHAPIIEIENEDEARAIWPLFDYIDDGTRALQGYGHYHEKYRRQPDGRWLISYLRLTRLRGDGEYPRLGS